MAIKPNAAHHQPSRFANTAEEWVIRLQAPDCSSLEHQAFEDWLAEAPHHPSDYAKAEQLYAVSAQLAKDPEMVIRAQKARQELKSHSTKTPQLIFLAASLAAVAVIAHMFTAPLQHETWKMATAIGERSHHVLSDGSTVTLDTDTVLEGDFSSSERRLTLGRGRVSIHAAHSPERPMIVHAGTGLVRVIGTIFQIQNDNGNVNVDLFDGRLIVNSQSTNRKTAKQLVAGQTVSYDRSGTLSTVHLIATQDGQSWLHGQLVFTDRPLNEILKEANRYSTTEILLGDQALASIRISATFNAGDQSALLAALEAGWNLHTYTDKNGNFVLTR